MLGAAPHLRECRRQPIERAELRPASGKILSAADSPRNLRARAAPHLRECRRQPIETPELKPASGKILSAADSPGNLRARGFVFRMRTLGCLRLSGESAERVQLYASLLFNSSQGF
ncbi:hypothetical protein CDAR_451711 [Caerostris darwini]|uniref:Uncharacterized protein n=1 Tax=Caerostris darwini TaxID=1538125 RepID=A0AAV4W2S0_9ARAC|nr:hypothetical protein CDAR_451711 [Caerostris darwini]